MSILGFGDVPGFSELYIILFVFVFVFIIPVIGFWGICEKTGFPGPMGLLMLIPLANTFFQLCLAFANWPALMDSGPSSIFGLLFRNLCNQSLITSSQSFEMYHLLHLVIERIPSCQLTGK